MAPKRKAVSAKEGEALAEVHDSTPPAVADVVADIVETSQAAVDVPAPAEAVSVAAAPSAPVPIAGTPAEMYNKLQSAIGSDESRINNYVAPLLELVQAAERDETPLLLRVRVLEFIGRHVSSLRDATALKKIVTSLVKIISGDDDTPQLLAAAIQCFAGLGPVSMLDKNWEYLSREGADVLMQVMIDKEAFPEMVRQAANRVLDVLTSSAFRSVVTKLLHWISDDHEDDQPEQIMKERHLAMARLTHLARMPSMRKQWTEEVQGHTLALIQRVLPTVNSREFSQLVRVAAHLPINKEKGSFPLLEAFLAAGSISDERALESLAALCRHVPAGLEADILPALQAASSLLQQDIERDSEFGVYASRVLLFAASSATAEGAEVLFPFVFRQVEVLLGNCCEDGAAPLSGINLATLEAVLLAAVAIAKKRSVDVLQKLNEEPFNATMMKAASCVEVVEKEAVFVVKKLVQRKEATSTEAELLAALHNIRVIVGAFSAKHLPTAEVKASWTSQHQLPGLKRTRDAQQTPLQSGNASDRPHNKRRTQSAAGARRRGGHR